MLMLEAQRGGVFVQSMALNGTRCVGPLYESVTSQPDRIPEGRKAFSGYRRRGFSDDDGLAVRPEIIPKSTARRIPRAPQKTISKLTGPGIINSVTRE